MNCTLQTYRWFDDITFISLKKEKTKHKVAISQLILKSSLYRRIWILIETEGKMNGIFTWTLLLLCRLWRISDWMPLIGLLINEKQIQHLIG